MTNRPARTSSKERDIDEHVRQLIAATVLVQVTAEIEVTSIDDTDVIAS